MVEASTQEGWAAVHMACRSRRSTVGLTARATCQNQAQSASLADLDGCACAMRDEQTRRAFPDFLPMKSRDEVHTRGFHFRKVFTTFSESTIFSSLSSFYQNYFMSQEIAHSSRARPSRQPMSGITVLPHIEISCSPKASARPLSGSPLVSYARLNPSS